MTIEPTDVCCCWWQLIDAIRELDWARHGSAGDSLDVR